jgi:hypothetical protein
VTPATADDVLYREALRPVLDGDLGREDLSALLDESGWTSWAESDPTRAVGLLFEEQGRQRVRTLTLDLLIGRAAGAPPDAAVVHSVICGAAGRIKGDQVEVEGVIFGAPDAGPGVVATADGTMTVPLDGLEVAVVVGIDPALRLHTVRGVAPAQLLSPLTADVLAARARRAVGHELVGVTEAMLAVAVEQVTNRHQFDRPIAAFQTVKHRLADVKVAVEAARSSLEAAWRSGDPLCCRVAKAAAGRAATLGAKHCQQVCGAIGFTNEHPLPSLVKRTLVLDALYGSATQLEHAIGSELLGPTPRVRPPTPW